ncbi:Translation initiation factor IF2 [Taphrina deformans PYCC 5710]|uniref:Eukaryotic translation initiation factor 5B n=1 Tax=Taphrina deformans (strain PYCC 5710 / ATCC 11124 / CBS 356.35 / IMI 108563 / JCM 9778 / NBRC 8474) TaxID=1097556 RepID=R4X7W0_TAPDE|nr:Translation initiation factor IF2 [Taphrina deformans PYCC 5710]|eukprot:CCG81520.1 Translation initiation factor IF2 [Taphrina deformans PYCC 5710]
MPPKKGKKKPVEDDWEAELGESLDTPVGPVEDEAPADTNGAADDDDGGLMSQLGKGKKGKKDKKKAKKQIDDDWEAELGEDLTKTAGPLDEEEEEVLPPVSKAPVEVNEIDEDDFGPPKKNKKGAAKAKPQSPTPQPDSEPENVPEVRVKTKAEKEREKKDREKAKKKAQAEKKKASKGPTETNIEVETKKEDPTREPEHEPEVSSAAAKGAKGAKKPNAKVLALQKAMAARQEEEARIRQLEQEERDRIAAEEAAIEEEERKKEEAKQRKKEREKAKIAEQKASGTFMTKKQKEAAALAERRKEQMLAAGMTVEGLSGASKAKRPVYDNRKKRNQKQVNGGSGTNSPMSGSMISEAPAEVPTAELEKLSVKEESKVQETPEAKQTEPEVEEEGALESWEAALDSDGEVKDSWDADSDTEKEIATQTRKSVEEEKLSKDVTLASTGTAKESDIKNEAKSDSNEEESSSDDDASGSDSGSDSESSEDEKTTVAKQVAAKKRQEALIAKTKRIADAKAARSKDDLRSPICCIMGHVDTGKTSLLDKVRQTNVQGGEAGGITQQIGATYFPMENIMKKTSVLEAAKDFEYKLPGLLVIDTPGHESFSNLRSRGSSLCNIAILVIDIMHGLEPQTIESIKMLRDKKTPFIVALNKIDRLYAWQSIKDNGFRESFAKQKKAVKNEFEDRLAQTKLALAEQGLNSELYYENKNLGRNVSLVPTSAFTGEGIPDLLQLLVTLSQQRMTEKLMYVSELECTVLEVKVIEGLGTTIDVVVVNGVLREGDRIVVSGLNGPIVTTIRAILTPQPLKELRIKGSYVHHKEVKAALGVKIAANDLEKAIAGSRMLRVEPGDDEEELKEEVMEDLQDLLESIDRSGVGVYVQASTLGALEALLEFLKTSKIPVSGINIGPVFKRDVMRCATMLEKAKEYAVMLCFDVEVDKDAQTLADQSGVTIFSADIIYHLFDAFTAHRAKALEQKRTEGAATAVFPCVLKTIAVFNKKDPIVLGVDVIEGSLRPGTPICAVKLNAATNTREIMEIGRVSSMEKEHKAVEIAKKGTSGAGIAVKLEMGGQPLFGRHVDQTDMLYSLITRKSIDVLKSEAFRESVTKEEWALIVKLKKTFGI